MESNIRSTNNPIEITGIGGQPIRIKHIGDLKGYGTIYHHPGCRSLQLLNEIVGLSRESVDHPRWFH